MPSNMLDACCYSIAKSCLTLRDPMDYSKPGLLDSKISKIVPDPLETHNSVKTRQEIIGDSSM